VNSGSDVQMFNVQVVAEFREIVEFLEAALEQFREIANDLDEKS
jgi:hypothetical protein